MDRFADLSAAVSSPYLAGLSQGQQEKLAHANEPGLRHLRDLLARRAAIGFLGAGASAPLYPLWDELIGQLVEQAADRLTPEAVATFRARRYANPDAVVELLRRELGPTEYRAVVRAAFRPRRDPQTGRTWTPTHELVVRCRFAGIVTTNYDPGIVNVRMAVRPNACGTAFASWTNEDTLDRWRTGDVFGDDELPVLYAHGHHNEPDAVVLAQGDYRRAYAGSLGRVLARIFDTKHVVWIGFSFADERIRAILRTVDDRAGTSLSRGPVARHLAIMPWDPSDRNVDGTPRTPDEPSVLRSLSELDFASRLVLYPAPRGDHSALQRLLESCVDDAFPAPPPHVSEPVARRVPRSSARAAGQIVRWVHGGIPVPHFTGRVDDISRLQRWAADDSVRLIGVNAWGGTGKTALVTEWLARGGAHARPRVRGIFAWSFYENQSVESWAEQMLAWAQESFGCALTDGSLAHRVLSVLRVVPLLLVLDGLEVMQEGPAGAQYGRLLDGLLRRVLVGVCQDEGEVPASRPSRRLSDAGRGIDDDDERDAPEHAGLVVLTSRFPFADLEPFGGGAVRFADVGPFTPAEGAELLARAGAQWVPTSERRALVEAVDGHALGVSVLASLLASGLGEDETTRLRVLLEQAGRTDVRVAHVLRFYADRLSDADRQLVALVSLFQRPVGPGTLLTLGADAELGAPLSGWRPSDVEQAVRRRLTGLLTWHLDGGVSAHPLVRDTFRELILSGGAALRVSALVLADMPTGRVRSREDGLRLVELIELLLAANDWQGADALFSARTAEGDVWQDLPAAVLGQRCAMAFVGTDERRRSCRERVSVSAEVLYLTQGGISAMRAGDVVAAEHLLRDAVASERALLAGGRPRERRQRLFAALRAFAESRLELGDAEGCREAAEEARALGIAAAAERDVWKSVHALIAAAAHLAGETRVAEWAFVDAQVVERNDGGPDDHLQGTAGCLWAEFLLQTRRVAAARRLAARNPRLGSDRISSSLRARCDRLLAGCDLLEGALESAGKRIETALSVFRDGDLLLEWGATLPVAASHRRRTGRLAEAERLCTEAIALAGPRAATQIHARALIERSRVRGDGWRDAAAAGELERARDDADHALHLATRVRRLPWLELDALEAHAHLDALEGSEGGWSDKADQLRSTILPAALVREPLVLADALMAQRKAAD